MRKRFDPQTKRFVTSGSRWLPVVALAGLLVGCTAGFGGQEVALDEPIDLKDNIGSNVPPGLGGSPAPSLGGSPAPSLGGAPEAALASSVLTPLPGEPAAAAGGVNLLVLFGATEVGQALRWTDVRTAERTAQESLESRRSGTQARWRNPSTGTAGTITPTRTYRRPDGVYCREFEQTVVASGANGWSRGTACRQPDAFWQLVR